MRRITSSWLRIFALLLLLAMVAAGCNTEGGGDDPGGSEDSSEAAEGGGGDLIVGTTDQVGTLDPAKAYDFGSSNVLFNVGEGLVGFEPGALEVSPLLAEDLPEISDDGLTYTFQIREGVKFHDGSDLDAEDVVFSLQRAINMNHPEGAGFLIAGAESIEATDELTVEITLAEPNTTFLSRLAYTVATIVPSDGDYTLPEEALVADEEGVFPSEQPEDFVNEEFVGTGPYTIGEFREGESITLEANPDYWGDAPANDRVLIQQFQTSAQMKAALENGEIDVAFRDFTPDERADLQETEGIEVIEGEGSFIRYMVLNTHMPPFDDTEARQAVAAAVERTRILDDVFAGEGEPLYSMIPTTFEEYQPFFEEYEGQDAVELAGEEPIEFDLWYTTDRYGDTEPSIAQTLERSLEESGAFEVNLQSAEYAEFREQAWPGTLKRYQAYLLAWFPDYFDADDYIEPFYATESFVQVYANDEMDELISEEQGLEPGSDERNGVFEEIQRLAADDVPIVPLFQLNQYGYVREGVEGVEETLDPIQIHRYWLISAPSE